MALFMSQIKHTIVALRAYISCFDSFFFFHPPTHLELSNGPQKQAPHPKIKLCCVCGFKLKNFVVLYEEKHSNITFLVFFSAPRTLPHHPHPTPLLFNIVPQFKHYELYEYPLEKEQQKSALCCRNSNIKNWKWFLLCFSAVFFLQIFTQLSHILWLCFSLIRKWNLTIKWVICAFSLGLNGKSVSFYWKIE